MNNLPSRQQAWELLCEFNKADRTLKHALAVEAVMRHMAGRYGGDAEQWAVIGLVHDLDFEMFPDQHCQKTQEILRQRGWPEEAVRAVVSHGWGVCSDVQPQSDLEKVLYAVDELTGLVAACALVRPSKSILDLEVKSVKKKWKEKSFAAGVDRGVIEKGAGLLNLPVEELIAETIAAMRPVAAQLGLAGSQG
jgi:putative nucleotidyltransferase with HDIG domain